MSFEAINIQDISADQSIKTPENLRINDDKVYHKKVGNALYIIPFHNPWQSRFESVDAFSQDFMNDRLQPGEQTRESFDE